MSITITDLRDASRIRSYIGEIRDRNGGRNPHVDARLAEAEAFLARADAPLTATPAPTAGGRMIDLSLGLHAAQCAELLLHGTPERETPGISGDSLLYPTLGQSWCMGISSKALRFFGWLRKQPVFAERPAFRHVAFLRSAFLTHWFWRLSMPRPPFVPPPAPPSPAPGSALPTADERSAEDRAATVSVPSLGEEPDPETLRDRKRGRARVSAVDGAADSAETR